MQTLPLNLATPRANLGKLPCHAQVITNPADCKDVNELQATIPFPQGEVFTTQVSVYTKQTQIYQQQYIMH